MAVSSIENKHLDMSLESILWQVTAACLIWKAGQGGFGNHESGRSEVIRKLKWKNSVAGGLEKVGKSEGMRDD